MNQLYVKQGFNATERSKDWLQTDRKQKVDMKMCTAGENNVIQPKIMLCDARRQNELRNENKWNAVAIGASRIRQ